jgi:excisionase family DNA binding protein
MNSSDVKNREYLSIDELSIKLCMKKSWIRAQVFRKKIPFIKVGARCIRFDLDQIYKWIEENNKK